MSSLITHGGLPLSEPMAFGLSSSLMFFHLPLIKVGGMPLTSYRMMPGRVVRGLSRQLGIEMVSRRFRSPEAGMAELDRHLEAGRPVGLQSSVYWLPYFPPEMRFHFNAHNLIVYGKQGGDYLISDPVFDQPQVCPAEDLKKARFTRGLFAPKGLLYYPARLPREVYYPKAIRKAVRRTVNVMLRTPVPFVGISAIRGLARNLARLPARQPDARYRRLYVGFIIRMQEEIGTGGGGFRFMYASFLQEAGRLLDNATLLEASEMMTATGDQWREFAIRGAEICKRPVGNDSTEANDRPEADDYQGLSQALVACADQEQAVFRHLLKGF